MTHTRSHQLGSSVNMRDREKIQIRKRRGQGRSRQQKCDVKSYESSEKTRWF